MTSEAGRAGRDRETDKIGGGGLAEALRTAARADLEASRSTPLDMRIGHGYDVHRLVAGRPLILGGVTVPSDVGLDGHSDADVLAHAVTDALLGAAAMGDIGAHFPDTDAEWKGADSIVLLETVVGRLREAGFAVGNVDATVCLQRPRLRPHVDAMRARLAAALGVDVSRVSVKATTGEGMGFVGTGEGAAAHAVALVLEAPAEAP